MRPKKQTKIKQSETKTQVCKKKNARKINQSWRWNDDVPTTKLENINEVLRIQKAQHVERKRSWKLVPKDSREVYRERRKKRLENRLSDESLSEDSQKRTRTRPKESEQVKKKPNKNTRKNRRRTDSHSSVPSSRSSMSTSCASTSDMEY